MVVSSKEATVHLSASLMWTLSLVDLFEGGAKHLPVRLTNSQLISTQAAHFQNGLMSSLADLGRQ